MGGKVAMCCALGAPDRVAELCVLDITPSSYSTADGTTWKKNIQLIDALASLDLASCDGDRRAADEQLARSVLDPNVRAFALTNLVVRPRVETSASRVASNKKDDATGPTR